MDSRKRASSSLSSPSKAAPRSKRVKDRGGEPICKTCTLCRTKKMKCDSTRPSCAACLNVGFECIYPQDTRCFTRPSKDRIADLEQKIDGIWQHLQTVAMPMAPVSPQSNGEGTARATSVFESSSDHAVSSLAGDLSMSQPFTPARSDQYQPGGYSGVETFAVAQRRSSAQTVHGAIQSLPREPRKTSGNDVQLSSLSPREAHIAGLDVAHDGAVSVHGASSMMHRHHQGTRTSTADERSRETERSMAAAKSRLFSYAAVQKQTEAFNYRNPPASMDLDGVEVELAKHLLDLHWNRQHYAYLLTYRPAIMDSLANGGRWCNKLLLNSMYYTSSLYSDRECLRTSPADTQSAGDRFYSRFRTLLADAIVNPSIPSAAAILLTGAALVSQGRQSAGWTLCGTAYRMVIDMGCHLSTDTSHSHLRTGGVSEIEVDIEREWRRRLYWGALVTDATQSMYLGRQVTLRPSQGRVSQMLLDHYEELEEWSPLIDEAQSPGSNALLLAYRPRPAYAVSTFNALVKLAMISTRITQTFYSIDCVKSSPDTLWQTKADIEGDLSDWLSELPTHLRLDFDKHVPPPHQITPHTTYHVLNILLRRPFLEGGYLQDSTIADAGPSNDQSCTDSALAIWKLVSAYRDTFTLRRSPFLLSYAVYSAVVVILRQSKNAPPDHFQDAIGFFLTALSELQRGCNFGLRRPVAIIRDMMAELGSTQPPQYQPENQSAFSSILEMCSFDPNSQYAPNNAASGMEGCTFAQFEPLPHDFFNVLDDQEQNIVNDPLYGLFAQEPGGYNFQAG